MILAANWKMNVTPDEARRFVERFLELVPPSHGRQITFFPSAVSLEAVAGGFASRTDILVGVQDVHWEEKGAFTGATSVTLAQAAGAGAALIGHSERRHLFGETTDDTRRKVVATVAGGLIPYLCVGETLAQREAGETAAVVRGQLRTALDGATGATLANLVVAYEPVWAIGTGRTATPEDAGAVHLVIQETLADLPEGGGEESVPILYGGSVNPDNARTLLAHPEIQGVLVGGASLDPETWAQVIFEADAARG